MSSNHPPAPDQAPSSSVRLARWLESRALVIAAGYAIVAALWILLSDRALLLLLRDAELLVRWSVAKGIFFVVVTAALLLGALRRVYGALERSHAAQAAAAKRLAASEQQLSAILTSARDAILAVDAAGCVVLFNDSAARLFGQSAEAALGRQITELFPDGLPEQDAATFVLDGLRADGDRFPAEISSARAEASGVPLQTLIVRDLTQRREHEREIERLNYLYQALGQISQAVVVCTDRSELLARVCRVLVEYGRFSLAWIGWHDPESGLVNPVASWGDTTGYLAQVRISVDPADPDGRGPFANTLRTGEPSLCNDLYDDPATGPWRDAAREAGLRAAAALPIQMEGQVVGLLAVYTQTPFEFREAEQALLEEAAFDIAFALGNLEHERRRVQAEAALGRSEQRYRSTLDSILEGCQLLDFDWTYLYLNPAAEAHNRRPNAELLGRKMPEVWPGIESTRIFDLMRRCLEERVAFHEEVEFVFPDGGSGWFDIHCQPVPEGLFVLSVETTKRRVAESALRELNESLEATVAARTAELAEALVRAEAADRLKSAFLATMSHELRTPLNSIIGFTGIVLQELAGPLNPEQSKQLGMVRSSARHLLELINDVLDLSKIEAGQLEVKAEPFLVRESVEKVTQTIEPQIRTKGLELAVSIDSAVEVMVNDRRRFEQILLNLLSNAVKFTDRGRVSVLATVESDVTVDATAQTLRVVVADTGMGIKEEDLASLFLPFRQLDSGLARQHEGTGLGLAICRRLAGLMGGSIAATSEWTEGTELTLVLPLRLEPELLKAEEG